MLLGRAEKRGETCGLMPYGYIYPNLGFPTSLKMGWVTSKSLLQRAFCAGWEVRDVFQGFRALGSMDRALRLVWLYCVIEDAVRQILGETRLRSPTPGLTDGEALTIEIFGETLGLNSDASIWRYASDHLREWFPGLGSEWNFVRRCANLSWLNVQDALFHPSRNAFDGLPLPVCRYARSRRDKRFRGPSALPSRRSTPGSRC